MSKRKLLQLVQGEHVRGLGRSAHADDLRARAGAATPPERSRAFCEDIGVTKADSVIDVAPAGVRHPRRAQPHARRAGWRCFARSRWSSRTTPRARSKSSRRVNNPENPAEGTRKVPFSRELYIEREDFMEDPPKKFFRLSPGREVRLRYAYFITCKEVVKDASGEITELRCTYDPATRGGDAPDGRKVKATLHWVSAKHAVPVEVRLFDRLFTRREPRRRQGRVPRPPQPRLPPVPPECLRRAQPGTGEGGRPVPVRAHGLLLRRPRFDPGAPGLQPDRLAEGLVGEGAGEGEGRRLS